MTFNIDKVSQRPRVWRNHFRVISMWGLITTKNARKSPGPVLESRKLDATVYLEIGPVWNRFWNRFEYARPDIISPAGKYTSGKLTVRYGRTYVVGKYLNEAA